jgi:hypothetical protein
MLLNDAIPALGCSQPTNKNAVNAVYVDVSLIVGGAEELSNFQRLPSTSRNKNKKNTI